MDDYEAKLQASFRNNFPLYDFMELSVERAPEGVFRCSMPLSRATSNHFGAVHAALQFALAEVMGGAVWVAAKPKGSDFVPVVRSFQIHFKRPAMTDLVAEVKFSEGDAQTLRRELKAKGRYDYKLESTLRNAGGDTIATATGDYAIRSAKSLA